MTDPQVAIFMLSLFIFLVLLGFPIAFTLIAMGVGFGYYAYYQADNLLNNQIFYLLNQNTYSVMENDVLVAIPLFLFMGYVVERANIVNRLFFSLQLATRHLPGSMAVAALATCAISKYYAYCVCGDSRIVSIKAVCCSNNSWIYVSWFLYDLCYCICIL